MEFIFYISSLIALVTTILVISHTNPMHALLYLIISLLSVAVIFFSLGAYFAGALEIIIYAGAIMVLFVFVVMMLNIGNSVIEQERSWLKFSLWIGPSIVSLILLIGLIYAIMNTKYCNINRNIIDAKLVGIALFDSYLLAVELISMLLLSSLIVAFHIGCKHKQDKILSNRLKVYSNKVNEG
ncbi:NADH-quinone oxidoreductase subunit J [Candidatus Profftia sp. (ex Adelges kitamiensis)]|uniref:NADH-quinone oxidoreductase subunit J n=1 Tax=Candidatus Profftia sp. (ex Adelges kitamiensis) TaxID=2864218 RepID=UPI001CE24059|nr:NADH-quinone oxidoreductase subunit J [Candidatus Profftia sp. (ex Adelges kitamiensis)]